jgi:uncharacterized protein YcbX
VGRVEQVWIYPVRSLAGRSVEAADIGPAGLQGDRVWAAVGEDGAVLRAKDEPVMSTIVASGDPGSDAAALSAALGRPVRLETGGSQPGSAPVHLVSRQAIDRAAAGEVPEGCSADDPRANLLLRLDAADDERGWVGRQLRVGTAVLQVTRTPKHCLGVYADVRQAGSVAVGDAVLL